MQVTEDDSNWTVAWFNKGGCAGDELEHRSSSVCTCNVRARKEHWIRRAFLLFLFTLGLQGPWLSLLHHWPEAAACVAPAAASCRPRRSLSALSFLHTLPTRHTLGTPTTPSTHSTRCLPPIQISSQCQVAPLFIEMKRRRRPFTSLLKSNGTGSEWTAYSLGWAGLAGWVGDVCCVNFFLLRHKLPQSWWLQTTPVYGLSVLYAKAQAPVARLSSHKIGVLAGLCSYLEPGGKAQLWRQNSVPCGCSAEVLASVLVLSWGLPSVSRGYSLPGVATIFKALKRQEKEGQRRKEREWERKGIHSSFFL